MWAALVLALAGALCYLLALFGADVEAIDLVVLGHVFAVLTLAVMNLPAVRVR
jgi:hypothetical protein